LSEETPHTYRELLEQEVATVRFDELEAITHHFESKVARMTPSSDIDARMLQQAFNLRRLLDHPQHLTDRQLLVALAALRYLVRDEDHASDTHEDDALVVQAAADELRELLERL